MHLRLCCQFPKQLARAVFAKSHVRGLQWWVLPFYSPPGGEPTFDQTGRDTAVARSCTFLGALSPAAATNNNNNTTTTTTTTTTTGPPDHRPPPELASGHRVYKLRRTRAEVLAQKLQQPISSTRVSGAKPLHRFSNGGTGLHQAGLGEIHCFMQLDARLAEIDKQDLRVVRVGINEQL